MTPTDLHNLSMCYDAYHHNIHTFDTNYALDSKWHKAIIMFAIHAAIKHYKGI